MSEDPVPAAAATSREPAAFWVRGGAIAVDGITAAALGASMGKIMSIAGFSLSTQLIVNIILGTAYSTLSVGAWGQTPGKMAAGIEIIATDGSRIGYGRAFGRSLAALICSLIAGPGLLAAAIRADKRALHDLIAGTRVVLRPGSSPARRTVMAVMGVTYTLLVLGFCVHLFLKVVGPDITELRIIRLENAGQFEKAAALGDALIRARPDAPSSWNSRCWSKVLAGRPADALPDCEKSLALGPTSYAYDSAGLAYLKLNRPVESVRSYDAAIDLKRTASSLYGRGLAKRAAGDRAGGDAEMAEALNTDPGLKAEYERYGVSSDR